MFAEIALLKSPYSTYTYELPDVFPSDLWQYGLRVAVPLGARNTPCAGFIVNVRQEAGLPTGMNCKKVVWPLEKRPLINPPLFHMIKHLSRQQGTSYGCVAGHTLPKGLRSGQIRLKYGAKTLAPADLAALSPAAYDEIAQKFLQEEARIIQKGEDAAEGEICILATDPPWPVRPAAKKQIQILDFLYKNGSTNRRRMLKQLGTGYSMSLDRLAVLGLVKLRADDGTEEDESLLPPPELEFELTEDQKKICAELKTALVQGQMQTHLLFGVTGSGKTAVYLELARACVDNGRSVLLLAPEVALAHKLRRDAAQNAPDIPVLLYHGYQSPAIREATFRKLAAMDKPCIVVGTRSALFLPLKSTGCIILDEEHDGSFKQDESFAYHAKDAAWFRMKHEQGLLLLGSATPDVKSFHASQTGKILLSRLDRRVGGGSMPPIEFIDIGPSSGLPVPGTLAAGSEAQCILAPASEAALKDCLASGNQAVILLNRRGYAPLLYCVNCGKTLKCPNCEIGLTFHKGQQRAICHYCGYSREFPSSCPSCGSMSYLPMGEGTERLAERLETIAGQPILRLDRDAARRPGRLEEILEAFRTGQAPFLVGTQMLSKGHHFPNVTLAIVADGDMGLNLPDYRATERVFQLLVQSAGRAGRGEKAGKVLIQTRNPEHYCWKYINNYDYEGFYAEELARRQKYNYPPFVRLGLLRISFPVSEKNGMQALGELGLKLRKIAREIGLVMLGPAPAPIAFLRGQKRFQCLFKASSWNPIKEIFFKAQKIKTTANLRLFLDLDPVNML